MATRSKAPKRPRPAKAEPVQAPLDSILEAIGGTPLLQLARLPSRRCASLWAKLEQLEPGGSVKDRIGLAMIEAAEREGRLRPGGTVLEPTSGNTGIGLALVCAAKGYKLILTMPENMSEERRALLAAYGAEIVLTPADCFMPQQFENAANPRAHREITGPELVASLESAEITPQALVLGVGTGGTLTGVGRVFKDRYPKAKIVAVEPTVSAVLTGYPPGVTRIQGLGAGFVPAILDRSLIDRVEAVDDEEAWEISQRLAKEEGLLCGISSGAAATAALRIGLELGPAAHVVTLFADTGERYFSMAAQFA
jgi:cysteine synthase A